MRIQLLFIYELIYKRLENKINQGVTIKLLKNSLKNLTGGQDGGTGKHSLPPHTTTSKLNYRRIIIQTTRN